MVYHGWQQSLLENVLFWMRSPLESALKGGCQSVPWSNSWPYHSISRYCSWLFSGVSTCSGSGGWMLWWRQVMTKEVLECLRLMISAPLMLFTFARGAAVLATPILSWRGAVASASGHLHLALKTVAGAGMGLFLGHLLFFFASQPGAGPWGEKSSIFMPFFSLLPVLASSVGPLCISGCSHCYFCTLNQLLVDILAAASAFHLIPS